MGGKGRTVAVGVSIVVLLTLYAALVSLSTPTRGTTTGTTNSVTSGTLTFSSSGSSSDFTVTAGTSSTSVLGTSTSVTSTTNVTTTTTVSGATGPRIGLDMAWYVQGYGSLHAVNPGDGAAVYNYLTHGWEDSGGLPDGTCPSGACSGGFFTAYAFEIHNAPLYPPQSNGMMKFIVSFIHAADNDSSGQRAKIFVRLVPENNFDSTLTGALEDFLQRIGPAAQNPAVGGLGLRGAQEGIFQGGGACCGGAEGPNFVPASVAYGPSGMNSFPRTISQFGQMWGKLQGIANAWGYPLGISTSLSSVDKYLGQAKTAPYAQWFMEDTGYGVCGQDDTNGTCTHDTWYSKVAAPQWDAAHAVGVVGGEWDQNWFVPNNPPYHVTQTEIRAMFQGFADGHAKNPAAGQYMFVYGMPYLTNDDATWVKSKGPCPYLPWFMQYATDYGFFTSFSTAPAAGPPGGGSVQSFNVPTGLYIHIVGDPRLHGARQGWTQTDPVYCCGNDSYRIDGQLINLETGRGVSNERVTIMEFDFTNCTWKALANVTTGPGGYFGYPNGGGSTLPPLSETSPPLPGTTRNQAYFYDAFSGDATYGPSNGVLEDLPVIP